MELFDLSPVTLTIVACTAAAALVFLRVLAMSREQWIEAHDVAREVHRLRTAQQKRRGTRV